MFLPFIVVVDVKPQRQMLSPLIIKMADVIAILSFIYLWQMLSHMIGMLQQLKMADVIAKWQVE